MSGKWKRTFWRWAARAAAIVTIVSGTRAFDETIEEALGEAARVMEVIPSGSTLFAILTFLAGCALFPLMQAAEDRILACLPSARLRALEPLLDAALSAVMADSRSSSLTILEPGTRALLHEVEIELDRLKVSHPPVFQAQGPRWEALLPKLIGAARAGDILAARRAWLETNVIEGV